MRQVLLRPEEIERITQKVKAINIMFAEMKAKVLERASIKDIVFNKLEGSMVINYNEGTAQMMAYIVEEHEKYLQSDKEIAELIKEGILKW